MRSKIGKVLRTKFDERIRALSPGFEKDVESYFSLGDRGYVSRAWPGFDAYLVLTISVKEDCFYIEVAWSTNGRYPHSVITDPDSVPASGDSNFRLNRLYDPRQYQGWHLSKQVSIYDELGSFEEDPIEVSLEKIDPTLDDVFDKIEKYALTYFDALQTRIATVG